MCEDQEQRQEHEEQDLRDFHAPATDITGDPEKNCRLPSAITEEALAPSTA
jgi:hypothetical protein